MNFIKDLQTAIEYIEDNLLESINYEDVAKHLHISSYHFHRTFSIVTEMTVNEYIRNRRLSKAGQEISASDIKVIDLALKYGYESPESFTKAFSRFHGITPNLARRAGAKLKSFNRLLIKIKIEGGSVLDYRIEMREGFKLLAKVRKFSNEIVSESGNNEIADFWKESGGDGTFSTLKQHAVNNDMYGLCAPISKESTHFDYGIGVPYADGPIPVGFIKWEVKPTLWAVFKCIGDNPDCIGETWNRIFREFLPGSEYEMLDDTDFELYSENLQSDCFCEIWIPVKKKLFS
ncbi:AraC family transcriptional regulator [Anaerobacillus isosaccharinicus]|uniref:Transcriptional regulator n=1 Tax=Anaerobacillus isosaccharinicus TaxID=1532552 RepID=A0A1S2MF16_9BACI|nr:AraC family transcriptional regulator [Anaerobacillus isosaccharinicus]MBA5586464.1 AraC family transcriptional regulator [Anaerobacillus isosaccharinicus]QOY35293.1 AraC family transcriptional regulator [Anaerobacillus isosaccharinicus]